MLMVRSTSIWDLQPWNLSTLHGSWTCLSSDIGGHHIAKGWEKVGIAQLLDESFSLPPWGSIWRDWRLKSFNRHFREIEFPANTIFLRDREIKLRLSKCAEKIFAKIKENKISQWQPSWRRLWEEFLCEARNFFSSVLSSEFFCLEQTFKEL